MGMLERVLRAVGRGIVTVLRVLVWEPVVSVANGVMTGVSDAIRRAMPTVLGGLVLWGVLVYYPGAIQFVIVIGVMLYGFKIMTRSFLPSSGKKRKK